MTHSIQNSFWFRSICLVTSFAVTTAAIPAQVIAESIRRGPKQEHIVRKEVVSRKLTAKEMDSLHGSRIGNPYFSGSYKGDENYKGVNIRTRDFSTSVTDLTFKGGYGIPIEITRSYSSNSIDEGPLGYGWTLSVDLRTTVGGLGKSSKGADLSTPVQMSDRPKSEVDPNIVDSNNPANSTQPVEAVLVQDSEGRTSTLQQDVDGVITSPPWEKNEYDAEYETINLPDGSVDQVLVANKCTTPEGSVMVYEKKGWYTGQGRVSWNASAQQNPSAPEKCNILKLVKAIDRQGNETVYTYGSTTVSYNKSGGTVEEYPLTQINTPAGMQINFTYSGNHLVSVNDNGPTATKRTVTYGYSNGNLVSVATPMGRTTTYGYGGTTDPSTGSPVTDGPYLLRTITDCRGISTDIYYREANIGNLDDKHVAVYRIDFPEDIRADYSFGTNNLYEGDLSEDDATVSVVEKARTTGHTLKTVLYWYGYNSSGQRFMNIGATSNSGPYVTKTYDLATGDMVTELSHDPAGPEGTITGHRNTTVTRSYNFFGQPLNETKVESMTVGSTTTSKTFETQHAYYGAEKYFQEKATRLKTGTNTWRYSYKEYYDNTAAVGKKGQTKYVYDNKHAGFTIDSNLPCPTYAVGQADEWKYRLVPSNVNHYSSSLDYDSSGRVTEVKKLSKIVSGTYDYTTTTSHYGSDGSPHYGGADLVTEDYGGINRTTETLAFNTWGEAIKTRDANGREFETEYNLDGQILSVKRTDNGLNKMIASYTYGTGGVWNGQVITSMDHLSGTETLVTYINSGPHQGRLWWTKDVNTSLGYTTENYCNYTDDGDQYDVVQVSDNARVAEYRYEGWHTLGNMPNSPRVPASINKTAWTENGWVNTGEQFNYKYEIAGRLSEVSFAQTPQGTETNYSNYPAATKATATYNYDMGGRLVDLAYNWNVIDNGGIYTKSPIGKVTADYSHPLALKASRSFYGASGGSFSLTRTESFGYDADFDYLTNVDYNDGNANEEQTWTYDASGNRASDSAHSGIWSYDHLNRITASPFGSYTHDSVGNRLTGPSQTFSWDELNRAVSINSQSMVYRSDGMRIAKGSTEYHYQGKISAEDFDGTNSTRYAPGARGIEAIITASGTKYPILDDHGDMISTLVKSGTSYSLGDMKILGAWGEFRSGSGLDQGHSANLGHRMDEESGLMYMRARFTEPWTGRFVNEDTARAGANWYSYCNNNPVGLVDSSGNDVLLADAYFLMGLSLALWSIHPGGTPFSAGLAMMAAIFFGLSWACCTEVSKGLDPLGARMVPGGNGTLVSWTLASFGLAIAAMVEAARKGESTIASAAVTAMFVYGLLCIGILIGEHKLEH